MIDIEKVRQALEILEYNAVQAVGSDELLSDMMQTIVDSSVVIAEIIADYERLQAKEIPMKPNEFQYVELEPSTGICKCGKECYSFENYCTECGQALDWSSK